VSEHPPAGLDVPDELPIDPDIAVAEDARDRAATETGPFARGRRGRWPRLERPVLGIVFAGGILGGLARYAATSVWPTPAGSFPWATFTVNTAGAFALALLVYVLAEVWSPHRHARALVGTGFLGAFTTFSSVAVSVDQLAAHDHPRTAVLYLAGSLLAAFGAASSGLLLGHSILASRQRSNEHHGKDSDDGSDEASTERRR
jgi:CrcB protein